MAHNKNSGLAETNRNYWKCDFKPADEVDIAGGGENIRKNKNWMKLRLEFNTARITNVAALNQSLRVSATDMAGNVSDTASFASQYESGDGVNPPNFDRDSMLNNALEVIPVNATYQKATEKLLDIVPYITKIETFLSGAWTSNPSAFNRTAQGRYPIWVQTKEGTDGETLMVSGFNLNTESVATVSGTNVTVSGLGEPFTSCNISMRNAVTSGPLIITSSGLQTINNANDNDRVTNKEPNNLNNNLLTDDRFIDVWDFYTLPGSVQTKYLL